MKSDGLKKGPLKGPFFAPSWDIGRLILTPVHRPLVMGVLNLTPDSFYDGGRHDSIEPALQQAQRLIAEGADVLDLGAESSRPGAAPITPEQERQRLLPVLEAVRGLSDIPITVDTTRTMTARAAVAMGADAINDISGGRDPEMLGLAATAGCGLILMHMQGTPDTMQDNPVYDDPVLEVAQWLEERCGQAEADGVAPERLMIDPGIGFGKSLEHNLALLGSLAEVGCGRALLLGASRKSFISDLTSAPVEDRLPGSLAALVAAYQGRSTMVRVHDVAESVQFLEVMAAFLR